MDTADGGEIFEVVIMVTGAKAGRGDNPG